MKKIIYIIVAAILLVGCDSFLGDYSQDLVVPRTVSDFDEIMLGSLYIPSKTVSELRQGTPGWWLHILDDDINTVLTATASRGTFEMKPYYYGYTTWQMEVGRQYDGSSVNDDSYTWRDLYQRINVANIVLKEIDDVDINSPKDYSSIDRIKGECYFLRAQFYFTLVNIYADAYSPKDAKSTLGIPIKLTEYVEHDKDKDSQFERMSVDEVYKQIVSDLNSSIDHFTKTDEKKPSFRASKEAAMLLLSRVYLFMQDWENSIKASEMFLENTKALFNYTTVTDGVAISDESPELVFSQGALNLQNVFTALGGDFCISSDLYDLYEDNDSRKSLFFAVSPSTDSVMLARKYKKEVRRSYVSDVFMLRTSEAYLNLMEARVMNDDFAGATRIMDEFLEHRITNYEPKTYSNSELIDVVRNERRKELCLEGHRWFDLRRYAVNEKSPFKKDIIRAFAIYNWDSRMQAEYVEYYKLEKDDKSYTFSIPKSVLDFDTGMPDNIRDKREYFERILNKDI